MTWDGYKFPEVQAEPEEAQIPSSSKCKSIASPSISLIVTLTLFGNLSIGCPFNITLGIFKSPLINLSLKFINLLFI